MYILGISAYNNGSSACLTNNGKIIAFAREEDLTGIKTEHSFPVKAAKYCMEKAGIDVDHLEYVSYYDRPFIKFERLIKTYISTAPEGRDNFINTLPSWYREKLRIKKIILRELGYYGITLFHGHHETHAAGAFFSSPFTEAAVLTVDGVGEAVSASVAVGKNNHLRIYKDIRFPNSLALLYSAFTQLAGFTPDAEESRLALLAEEGKPELKEFIYHNIIDVKDDGSYRLNMEYFNYESGLIKPNDKFLSLSSDPGYIHSSAARSIQEVAEETILKIAVKIKEETSLNNLCFTGGLAYNEGIVKRLKDSGLFNQIWVQSDPGNAGSSVGSALYTWYTYLGNERTSPDEPDNNISVKPGNDLPAEKAEQVIVTEKDKSSAEDENKTTEKEYLHLSADPEEGELKTFGKKMFLVLFLLFLLLFLGAGFHSKIILFSSIGFLALAFLKPLYLKIPEKYYNRVVEWFQKYITPLLLSSVFYIVITPAAYVYRWMNKSPLDKGFDKNAESYWNSKE